MKKISLTLAAFLCLTSTFIFAQQADTLNKLQPTQNQYRTGGTTGQNTIQNPATRTQPRTSGSTEIEKQVNPQPQNGQTVPQTSTGSQGTITGSSPYDKNKQISPTVPQGTLGTNPTGTTGTTSSGTYGTGTSGTNSSYGTGNNSTTTQDSTLRRKQK